MADIRIKDLTTLESASLTGDVFVIDGTTGTRKLSAFSPTFGGNATVTGTLTANGQITSSGGLKCNRPAICPIDLAPTDDTVFWRMAWESNAYNPAGNRALYIAYNGSTTALQCETSGVVKIPNTSSSTSTSSGALVVGNGTSGGLGVGGAIVAGGTITSTASTDSGLLQLNLVNSSTGTSASSLFRFNAGTRTATLQAYNDTHATLAGQLRIGTSNGDIVLIPSGVAAATFGASSISLGALSSATTIIGGDTGSGTNILLLKDGLGTLKVNFKGNGDIAVLSSTASTTTSSGALVVSGGVGVAGNLSIGGDVLIDKSAIEVLLKRGANTNDGLIKFQTGILGDFAIGNRGTSDSDLHIYNYGTAADALKIAKSDSLATFAAAIRTAAPSGGTAANWKLGTVASVSPTSPNRTIEVDIGGTIYYIHAKTTNN